MRRLAALKAPGRPAAAVLAIAGLAGLLPALPSAAAPPGGYGSNDGGPGTNYTVAGKSPSG
jgi:hypothetical protein